MFVRATYDDRFAGSFRYDRGGGFSSPLSISHVQILASEALYLIQAAGPGAQQPRAVGTQLPGAQNLAQGDANLNSYQ